MAQGQASTGKAGHSKAGWINAVLIPVKQHLGCCVLLPVAANAMGGSAAAWLATPAAEWTLFATVPPLVTYGVMKAEQKIHEIRHRKKHDCACNAKIMTGKSYLKQTALAYLFYAASHFITHDVLKWSHDHDKEIPKKEVMKKETMSATP